MITLRHFTERDVEAYLHAHDELAKNNFNSTPQNADEAKKEVEKWLAEYKKPKESRKEEAFVIEYNGAFAGWINIHDIVFGDWGVVTYLTEPRFRGKGLATTALKELVAHAKKEYGLRMISGRVKTHNIGSIKVLEKAGFSRTKIVDTEHGKKYQYELQL